MKAIIVRESAQLWQMYDSLQEKKLLRNDSRLQQIGRNSINERSIIISLYTILFPAIIHIDSRKFKEKERMKWTDNLVNQKIIIQNNLFIYYKYNKLL